jgi:RNA polymerase sigma factor (sigma-70 family)
MTDEKPSPDGVGASRTPAVPARHVAHLQARALAALPFLRDAFPAERFALALERSGAGSGDTASQPWVEDLALAVACADGHEAAWDYFVRAYRPQLYAAARAIVREGGEAAARELADSVYAELFGLSQREGKRRSLFDYFHGRSKLSTWLRAVLAQRYVDSRRAASRLESLDAQVAAGDEAQDSRPRTVPEPVAPAAPPDPDRARLLLLLQRSLEAALVALDPRDRLRLALYYVQDLTLAQIGRLVDESEATVSRKLERTRRELRAGVERSLREAHRLSDAELRLCFEYAAGEWPFDLTAALGEVPKNAR